MQTITVNVGTTKKINIMQYDHKACEILFRGFDKSAEDSRIVFALDNGHEIVSKDIENMSLTVDEDLTRYTGVFSCQLAEIGSNGYCRHSNMLELQIEPSTFDVR